MKKDFESQLRKQMEGYEVAPPDDLWQRIEGKIPADSQLLSQKEKARKGAIVPLRRWVAVAAATLLVVGGVGLLLHGLRSTGAARHTGSAVGHVGSVVEKFRSWFTKNF